MARIALYSDIFYANLGLSGGGIRSRSLASGITGTLSASLGLGFRGGRRRGRRCLRGHEVGPPYGHRYPRRSPLLAPGDECQSGVGSERYDVGDLGISGNRAIARSGSVDWVDPVVGGRIRYNLAPGQDFILRGDVGGFGVGSQFSWNALAAYSFVFSKRDGVTYSGLLGYRALSADYEQGSGRTKYVYDVVMHGPVTGLTVGF